MKHRAIQRWLWVHKWSSLVCTLFLLMACVTGLPLIFKDEIADLLDTDPPYAELPANTPAASLDALISRSRAMYPSEIITSIFIDDDEPKVLVSMAPSWERLKADRKSGHWIKFDSRTSDVLKQSNQTAAPRYTFLGVMLQMHRELFANLPGELFMGLMGLVFVVAIVSGIAVYGPFMRKLEFATIRTQRSERVKWLDLHNLLGIVTAVWTLVVGMTGVINELSTPLVGLWLLTDVKLEPFKGKPVPEAEDLASLQQAVDLARGTLPGMIVTRITFPRRGIRDALALCHQPEGSCGAKLAFDKLCSRRCARWFVPQRRSDAMVFARLGNLAPAAFRRLWRNAT